jgi:hypothetical protein
MSSIRITKTIAYDASIKMKDAMYDDKIKDISKKMSEKVEEIVKKYIPSPLIACVREYRDYFYASNSASITTKKDNGYDEYYIYGSLSFALPNSCNSINVSREDYNKVRVLYDERESLITEAGEFQGKIYDALMALRTLNNVKKELPEAVKYLDIHDKDAIPAPVYKELNELIGNIK